jgi:phosphoketolase
LTDLEFEALFTPDKPVIFNFHSYPWLVHRLTYRRPGQHNIHVRGYKEQGNINTPLELAIRNQTDRFSLTANCRLGVRVPYFPILASRSMNRFFWACRSRIVRRRRAKSVIVPRSSAIARRSERRATALS